MVHKGIAQRTSSLTSRSGERAKRRTIGSRRASNLNRQRGIRAFSLDKIIPVEKSIFTLGTSHRTWKEFINLLRAYKVEMVIDVRSFPTSRFAHFKQEPLKTSLAESGFGYYYLGKELGGYRKGGYEAYTQTLPYLVGIELLERMSSRCRSAILCAERLPWRCHRRFIGRSLQERSWGVTHIIDDKRVWKDQVPEP